MKRFNNEVEKALKEVKQHMEVFDSLWRTMRQMTAHYSLLNVQSKDGAPVTKASGAHRKSKKLGGNRPQLLETDVDHCQLKDDIESLKDELEIAHKKLYKYRNEMDRLLSNGQELKAPGKQQQQFLDIKKDIEHRSKKARIFYLHGESSDITDVKDMYCASRPIEWITKFVTDLSIQMEELEHKKFDNEIGLPPEYFDGLIELHTVHIAKLRTIQLALETKILSPKGYDFKIVEEDKRERVLAGEENALDSHEEDCLEVIREKLHEYIYANEDFSCFHADDIYDVLPPTLWEEPDMKIEIQNTLYESPIVISSIAQANDKRPPPADKKDPDTVATTKPPIVIRPNVASVSRPRAAPKNLVSPPLNHDERASQYPWMKSLSIQWQRFLLDYFAEVAPSSVPDRLAGLWVSRNLVLDVGRREGQMLWLIADIGETPDVMLTTGYSSRCDAVQQEIDVVCLGDYHREGTDTLAIKSGDSIEVYAVAACGLGYGCIRVSGVTGWFPVSVTCPVPPSSGASSLYRRLMRLGRELDRNKTTMSHALTEHYADNMSITGLQNLWPYQGQTPLHPNVDTRIAETMLKADDRMRTGLHLHNINHLRAAHTRR